MNLNVTVDSVLITSLNYIHVGEYNVNQLNFTFSSEYTSDLVINAVFQLNNGNSYQMSVLNGQCSIPQEVLQQVGNVVLGVYAYKVNGQQLELRYSPFPTSFVVINGSYDPNAQQSQEITPTQFEQYMQALNDGLNKVEESLKKMNEATSSATQLVDDINQKLENGDFIGPEGPQGPQGVPGKDGINGTNGKDGVGITTITSGQSTIEQDKTITPVTVQKSDGSSQSFNVEAKNGLDGQNGQDGKDGVNGQDGLTPTIGENGNWFLGDTDTGKPSRGEVGPSPDLSNYVKNTDYAKDGKAGVVTPGNNLLVNQENGTVYCRELSLEQYKDENVSGAAFVAKKTLQNIRDYFVETSSPVITLNNTLDNLVPKNRVSDYIVSLKDALKYKVFEFLVHGKVKQETTTGKNLLNYLNVKQFVSNGLLSIINNDGSITTTGTPTTKYVPILESINITDMLEDGQTYTIMQKNATNKLYLQVTITTNSDEISYIGLNNNTENIKTFTVDKQNNKKYSINIQSNIIETTGELNITNYYQLLKGSYDEWQPFEKYTGGQPSPNPDYPQEITTLSFDKITRCGKNLFDYEDTISVTSGITVDDEGWITISGENNNNSGTVYKNYFCDTMRLKYNTDYNIVIEIKNVTGIGSISFISADANKSVQQFKNSFGKQLDSLKNGEIINAIMTSKADFSNVTIGIRTFVSFVSGQSGSITFRISVIEDISVTPQNFVYEPYQATEYTIDLQGNEMVELPNGVKDELVIDKEGNVSLIKNVGKVVYDGVNKKIYYKQPSITSDTKGFYQISLENKNISFSNGYTDAIKCNYFIARSGTAQSAFDSNDSGIWWEGNTSLCYLILEFTTLDEVNNWLSTHNTTIYYQLATPQTIPLGKLTDIITTLNGTNNISINGNIPTTISTTYALDIKKYIDNKLAEISTAMIEEG